jgi:hypothetical protein
MSAAIARVPLARITRSRRAWATIAAWFIVGLVGAVVVRARGNTTGADHMMRSSYGFLVLPLVAYATVGATLGGAGLKRAIRGIVVLGGDPRRAALVTTLVAIVFSALFGALSAIVICAIAHGSGDAPLASDLFASSWIGALGGAAYAAYFCAGSAIGRGSMRGVFLGIDWIIGSGAGFGALFTPRGHVTSLLGGVPVFEVSSRVSSAMLFLLVVLWTAIAVALGRRPQK